MVSFTQQENSIRQQQMVNTGNLAAAQAPRNSISRTHDDENTSSRMKVYDLQVKPVSPDHVEVDQKHDTTAS